MWRYSRLNEQEGGLGTRQRYIISRITRSGNADTTEEKMEDIAWGKGTPELLCLECFYHNMSMDKCSKINRWMVIYDLDFMGITPKFFFSLNANINLLKVALCYFNG